MHQVALQMVKLVQHVACVCSLYPVVVTCSMNYAVHLPFEVLVDVIGYVCQAFVTIILFNSTFYNNDTNVITRRKSGLVEKEG